MKSFTLYIRSKSAEAGPPLGTILGNIGVNAVKFCKDFNEYTKDIPDYFLLTVFIIINRDKSYSFKILDLALNNLLSLLIKVDDKGFNYINYQDLIKLAIFKFQYLKIEQSVSIVYSIVKLRNIKIYEN